MVPQGESLKGRGGKTKGRRGEKDNRVRRGEEATEERKVREGGEGRDTEKRSEEEFRTSCGVTQYPWKFNPK